ncbi:MAG: glutaredoxin family protein [Rhizobacter sp.]|nr:glutaredoxin family protein [Burkholderiales bacterium]
MKTSVVLSLLAVAVMTPFTVDAQQVYRWVDADGRVQYSDQAPPAGTKNVQEKNVGGSSIQNNDLPLPVQDAQKKNPVTVYISECGESCDAAKAYLSKRGIPHTVVDPTRSLELNKKFKEETGSNVVPVLKVGDKRLSGWSESTWASSLDAAGYPKTPPFSKPKPVEDRAGLDPTPAKAPAADAGKSKTATPSKG